MVFESNPWVISEKNCIVRQPEKVETIRKKLISTVQMSYQEDLAKDFMSSIYCELSLYSPVSFKKLQVQTQRINRVFWKIKK